MRRMVYVCACHSPFVGLAVWLLSVSVSYSLTTLKTLAKNGLHPQFMQMHKCNNIIFKPKCNYFYLKQQQQKHHQSAELTL